jgi:hypothetical protein
MQHGGAEFTMLLVFWSLLLGCEPPSPLPNGAWTVAPTASKQTGGTDVVATRLASNTYTTAGTFTHRPEMQLGCVSGEVQLVIDFNERTLDTQELVNPGSRESAEANITFAVDGEVYFTAWVHEVVGVTANGLQFDEPATTFDVSVMSEQALAPVWEACGL